MLLNCHPGGRRPRLHVRPRRAQLLPERRKPQLPRARHQGDRVPRGVRQRRRHPRRDIRVAPVLHTQRVRPHHGRKGAAVAVFPLLGHGC